MKKLVLVPVLMLLLQFSYGQGISFHKGDFASALSKARTEGKFVFVDFYAVWCAPCKYMVNAVFPDTGLAVYFSQNYVSLQIDAEREERALLNKVNVEAYPTLAVFDADGKLLYQSKGALDVPSLLKMAKMVREFDSNKEAYEQDPKNLSALNLYLNVLSQQDPLRALTIAQKHLKSITTEQCTLSDNWEIVRSYDRDPDSRFFLYSLENFRYFIENMPGYQEYFTGCAGLIIERAVELRDEKLVQRYKDIAVKAIGQMNMPVSESFLYEVDVYYFSQTGQKEKHLLALDKWMMDPFTTAGTIAQTSFEIVERYGAGAFSYTERWAKKSLEKEQSFFTYMAMANVYRSNNMKKEALDAANMAKQLAGPEDDMEYYAAFIESLQSMK